MKKPKHPLENRLRNQLMVALSVTLAIMGAVSFITNNQHHDSFIYQQLQNTAKAKALMDSDRRENKENHTEESESESEEESEDGVWVAHFAVTQQGNGLSLTVDPFTERLFSSRDKEAIEEMAEKTKDTSVTEGKFYKNRLIYYYTLVPLPEGNRTMVFYTTTDNDSNMMFLLWIFLLMSVSVFWISKHLARSIVTPVRHLESFADQIAKRNWSIPKPQTVEDEIGQLGDALETMRNALKSAEDLDKQFLQAASHDLKTPVMIIQGYAQELIDRDQNPEVQKSASVIFDESTRLQRRIQQLLRYTTLGHTLEFAQSTEALQLDRMIRRMEERFAVLFPNIHWRSSLDSCEILGYSDALSTAIENLMENQSRYARTEVKCTLQVQGGIAVLKISNDGPAFDTENPNDLFEPFKKSTGGKFGLGLAIVKQVVIAHGGTAQAENSDTGVLFTLTFPVIDPIEEA